MRSSELNVRDRVTTLISNCHPSLKSLRGIGLPNIGFKVRLGQLSSQKSAMRTALTPKLDTSA